MKKRKKYSGTNRRLKIMDMIGTNVTIIQILLSAVALGLLYLVDLLPMKYFLIVAAIVVLLILICRLLMKKRIKVIRWVFGMVISVALCVFMVFASVTLASVANTLQTISGVSEEVSEIGVYVLADDSAETINDTQEYTFGIMESLLREDSESTIAAIEEELDAELTVIDCGGMTEIADALLDGTCGAIIFSADYVDMLTDEDGYEEFDTQVKELTTYSFTTEIEEAEDDEDGAFIMYMSGIDTTGSVSTKSRSDVNILAVVNTNTHQVLLLSTPRDYYVELAYSAADGAYDKLTHAGLYGVLVSKNTLANLYDVDIDYYFRTNFTGFEELIDALGGITVYSEYAFTATKGGYYYYVGYNDLTGAEALSFARERKAFSSGDIQRGKNQMAVIEAVIDKMLTTAMLQNFTSILESVEDCFETNMSYSMITGIVKQQLDEGGDWNVQTYSVSGTGSSEYTYSGGTRAYVMIPDDDTVEYAKELIQQVLDGETISIDDEDTDEE